MKVPKNTFRNVCRSNGSRLQLKNSIRSPSLAIFLQNQQCVFFSELIVLILALKDNFCLILLLMGIIAASTTVYSELKSEFKFFNAIKWQRLNNSFG